MTNLLYNVIILNANANHLQEWCFMENLVSLENVSFSYDNNTFVIKNLNLNINKGDFIGIVGANGAGKSTLLKLVLGLIECNSGKIIRKKGLTYGYINQTTSQEEGSFPATVYEIVSLGLKKKPFSFITKSDKKEVDKVLEIFGLTELKNKSINSLSGGQMQKVKIAKVLLSNPNLIIFDEPTTGIDEESVRVLFELINHLHAMKKTILIVSHNKEDLSNCNRIIELGNDKIKEASYVK